MFFVALMQFAQAANEPVSTATASAAEPITAPAVDNSTYYSLAGLGGDSVNLSAQTVVGFAQTVVRKGASAYNIDPKVFAQIQQDIAYLQTSLEVGNTSTTADQPVINRLFNNCLTAEHSNVNALIGKIPGISDTEQAALTSVLTATAQALVTQAPPKTLADCCSCFGKFGMTIAMQLLTQTMK
ncbi:MAG: hypothetical protein CNLJKLNK_00186 [Holosporales bacterium]